MKFLKSIQRKLLLIVIPLSSIFFSSCGYHLDDENISTAFPTISIPYFQGDKDGRLTDGVIRALATLGEFNYAHQGGVLILEGKILSDHCGNIGYQYDRQPVSGERIHRLIPNEGRREICVEIKLVDRRTLKTLYGPFVVTAFSDYDFIDSDSLQDASFINAAGRRESVLFFSLGQLDSMDGAKAASLDPIYQNLGKKIAEGLSNLPSISPNDS